MATTEEMIKTVEDGLQGIKDELDARIDRKFDKLAQELAIAPDSSVRGSHGNPFAKLAADAGVKSVAEGRTRSAIVKLAGGISSITSTKSMIVGDTAGTDEDGYAVAPQRSPMLANDPRRALSLLDYVPHIRVSSNVFEYNRLDGYTNAAGYQTSEGALKPEGALPTDLVQAAIATIAHWIPASRQVLADAPALQMQIANLMQYGVRRKLETELIAGLGGAGKIAGLTYAGNYTSYTLAASDDTLADAVGKAVAAMDTAGWNPGLVIVNPTDWRDARAERADAGAGLYVAGSWRDPAPPSIWGVPVITNAAVTAGNFICLDPSQVVVLDRMDATVEVGMADDDFVRNKVRILAELRAGLAVLSPGAVMFGDYES